MQQTGRGISRGKSPINCAAVDWAFFLKLACEMHKRRSVTNSWPTVAARLTKLLFGMRKRERKWQTNNLSAVTVNTVKNSPTGRPVFSRSASPLSTTNGRFPRWCRPCSCVRPAWALSPCCKAFWVWSTVWLCLWLSSTASSIICTSSWATPWYQAGSPRLFPSSPRFWRAVMRWGRSGHRR